MLTLSYCNDIDLKFSGCLDQNLKNICIVYKF